MAAMVSKSKNTDDYVAALPDGVREVFQAVRETITDLVPEADETIKYDTRTWRFMGTYLIYAAAWKNHIGLYPVYHGGREFEELVGSYRNKKDIVKFFYSQLIPYEVIEQIVIARRSELEAS